MEVLAAFREFNEDDEVDLERDMLGRIRREYFPRIHPFQRYREAKFQSRYRLTCNIAACLADDFGESPFANRGWALGGGLSHRDRFCLGLRYLATGAFYGAIGDTQGVHKSTVCRAVNDVTDYLFSKRATYIIFPHRHEYHLYARDFGLNGFPCVIGCIDGTHIAIQAPNENERVYVNRKWYHSINVLAVCDAHCRFSLVDARFPGSTHDAYVFRRSILAIEGERQRFHGYWFLGDSGYPLKSYLMTPVLQPVTNGDEAYNEAHMETRSIVERSFGVLKRRWRCLDESGGVLLSKPERACKLIMACFVLHNIAVQHNLDIRIDNDWDGRQRPRRRLVQERPNVFDPPQHDLEVENPPGGVIRARLINTNFEN